MSCFIVLHCFEGLSWSKYNAVVHAWCCPYHGASIDDCLHEVHCTVTKHFDEAKLDCVQGNCSTQPDAADFPGMNGIDLVPTTTGQCFLLTHDDMLGIVGHRFWADNLYLRAALPPGQDRIYHFPALVVLPTLSTGVTSGVYLTNMIFQGDGDGSVVGVGTDDKVFVSGAFFLFFCWFWPILYAWVMMIPIQHLEYVFWAWRFYSQMIQLAILVSLYDTILNCYSSRRSLGLPCFPWYSEYEILHACRQFIYVTGRSEGSVMHWMQLSHRSSSCSFGQKLCFWTASFGTRLHIHPCVQGRFRKTRK